MKPQPVPFLPVIQSLNLRSDQVLCFQHVWLCVVVCQKPKPVLFSPLPRPVHAKSNQVTRLRSWSATPTDATLYSVEQSGFMPSIRSAEFSGRSVGVRKVPHCTFQPRPFPQQGNQVLRFQRSRARSAVCRWPGARPFPRGAVVRRKPRPESALCRSRPSTPLGIRINADRLDCGLPETGAPRCSFSQSWSFPPVSTSNLDWAIEGGASRVSGTGSSPERDELPQWCLAETAYQPRLTKALPPLRRHSRCRYLGAATCISRNVTQPLGTTNSNADIV